MIDVSEDFQNNTFPDIYLDAEIEDLKDILFNNKRAEDRFTNSIIDTYYLSENPAREYNVNYEVGDDTFKNILKEHYDKIFNTDQRKIVMEKRLSGVSLDDAGSAIGASRERARQIEVLVDKYINNTWKYYEKDILARYFTKDFIFKKSKFIEEIGYFDETIYVLKDSKEPFQYVEMLEKIIYDCPELKKILNDFLKVPRIYNEELKSYKKFLLNISPKVRTIFEEIDLEDFLVEQGYYKYPKFINKRELLLGEAILEILKDNFPDGIDVRSTDSKHKRYTRGGAKKAESVYNKNFLEFEHLLLDEYSLSSHSRKSLIYRIGCVAVVYGNGIYAHPCRVEIDSDLAVEILSYVLECKEILFSDLYEKYKERLNSSINFNIVDQYKLHGAISRFIREERPDFEDKISIMRGKIKKR